MCDPRQLTGFLQMAAQGVMNAQPEAETIPTKPLPAAPRQPLGIGPVISRSGEQSGGAQR